jgi:hypothetical protein
MPPARFFTLAKPACEVEHRRVSNPYLPLCVPPIPKYQIDPGFSNGLEILGVAGYKLPIQPNGYGSNQAVG